MYDDLRRKGRRFDEEVTTAATMAEAMGNGDPPGEKNRRKEKNFASQ